MALSSHPLSPLLYRHRAPNLRWSTYNLDASSDPRLQLISIPFLLNPMLPGRSISISFLPGPILPAHAQQRVHNGLVRSISMRLRRDPIKKNLQTARMLPRRRRVRTVPISQRRGRARTAPDAVVDVWDILLTCLSSRSSCLSYSSSSCSSPRCS